MTNRRTIVIALLLTGAALLVYAALARAWWHASDGSERADFGLLGMRECLGDHCTTTSYSELTPSAEDRDKVTGFVWTGRITMGANLCAAAGALLGIVMVLAKRRNLYERGLARGSAGIGLIVGLIFINSASDPISKLSFGAAFYCHWAGIVMVVVAELLAADLDVTARSR